jgi:hypothetical protein
MIKNNKIVLESKVDKSLLISLLTVLLFPLFPTIFGNNSFHVIPFVITFSFLILYKKNGNRFFIPKNNSTQFVVVFFCITFLLLCISLFNDFHFQNASLSYFMGVIKPLYLFLFFLVGFSNKINDFKIVYTFAIFFEIAIILCFCYVLFEIIFIEEFKGIIYFLYKREERFVLIDKATGWFGVTYYFAYFCLLLFFYSFFMLSKSFNFKYLFLTLFAFVPLVLSQSRTVIIAFLFGFIIIPFLRISNKNKKIYLLFFFFLIATITLFIIYFDFIYDNFRYAYSGIARLTEGINLNDEGSIQTRYKQFVWAFDNNIYKVIGFGLGREEGLALESIYASYMYRFGIIYLLIYLLIIYKFYQISAKLALLFKDNNILYSFFSASSLFYITSPISLIASPSHEMPKIAFIVFIMSGIVYRFNYKYLN